MLYKEVINLDVPFALMKTEFDVAPCDYHNPSCLIDSGGCHNFLEAIVDTMSFLSLS